VVSNLDQPLYAREPIITSRRLAPIRIRSLCTPRTQLSRVRVDVFGVPPQLHNRDTANQLRQLSQHPSPRCTLLHVLPQTTAIPEIPAVVICIDFSALLLCTNRHITFTLALTRKHLGLPRISLVQPTTFSFLLAQAYSDYLPGFGMNFGFKNNTSHWPVGQGTHM